MRALPPLVMLAIGLYGITGPSYWRDEAATLTAVQRPFGQLLRMLGNVDAVHGAYYVAIWVVVRLAGTGELALRLPSALAMAGAAAAVAAIGRRLVSPGAGLAAGLVFAVLPQVSFYAQDAREYAIVTVLAASASYLLARLLGAVRPRRGWLAGYAVCLGVMGCMNVMSLLLIPAHGVSVALAWRRASGRGAGAPPALGWLPLRWLCAAAVGVLLSGPVLVDGLGHRHAISWISVPTMATILRLGMLIGPGQMVVAVALAVAAGIGLCALAGPAALRASWPPALTELAVPWLVLPPAVAIGVSFAAPIYVFRYVLFCAPAAALLAGTGLASLARAMPGGAAAGRAAAACAFAVIALLGVPAQLGFRGPAGHGTDIRRADQIVAGTARPGDAVLYHGPDPKYFPAAYPYGLAQLDDIAQARTPSQAGNLTGKLVRAAVVRRRLAHVRRVWLVAVGNYPQHRLLEAVGFRRIGAWHPAGIWLLLYARSGR